MIILYRLPNQNSTYKTLSAVYSVYRWYLSTTMRGLVVLSILVVLLIIAEEGEARKRKFYLLYSGDRPNFKWGLLY